MAFTARTFHKDATVAFAGKTIHGHGPTAVSKREAEHLRGNYAGVVVEEVEGPDAEDQMNDVPARTDAEERREHELRERRGEFEPKFDHGFNEDPESDPYRERREIQHEHAPEFAREQAEHQKQTKLATKNQRQHKPLLAKTEGSKDESKGNTEDKSETSAERKAREKTDASLRQERETND